MSRLRKRTRTPNRLQFASSMQGISWGRNHRLKRDATPLLLSNRQADLQAIIHRTLGCRECRHA